MRANGDRSDAGEKDCIASLALGEASSVDDGHRRFQKHEAKEGMRVHVHARRAMRAAKIERRPQIDGVGIDFLESGCVLHTYVVQQ